MSLQVNVSRDVLFGIHIPCGTSDDAVFARESANHFGYSGNVELTVK